MPFEKGKEKTGGRQKGTPNKSTNETRELITQFVNNELEVFMSHTEKLDLKDRLLLVTKLLPYALPKINSIDIKEKDPNERSFLSELTEMITNRKNEGEDDS
jgi:hypothetical protein